MSVVRFLEREWASFRRAVVRMSKRMRTRGRRAWPPKLIVGLPSEWEGFEERHRQFLELFPSLKAACVAAFPGRKLESLADGVVLGTGRLCAEEFLEILLLCGNGYGIAAMKLLRSLFERVVTARYINAHPDDADPYVRYSAVQKGKLARVLLEQFRDGLSAKDVALLEQAVKDQAAVKDDFKIKCDNKNCGVERPSPTWGKDVVSMAREFRRLRILLSSCYYETLLHVHATPHSVEAIMKLVEGKWKFDIADRQRAEVGPALFHAHTLLLEVLELQRERFNPEGLAAALNAAEDAYGAIWNVPAAPPSEPAAT